MSEAREAVAEGEKVSGEAVGAEQGSNERARNSWKEGRAERDRIEQSSRSNDGKAVVR